MGAMCLSLAVAGCSRAPKSRTGIDDPKGKTEQNAFTLAAESFRTPENVGGGDDVSRFRDGLQALSAHFSKTDVAAQMRLSGDALKFLKDDAHLTAAELAEVDSLSFRSADAYYLDECFLFADVSRSIEVAGLGPIEQAHHHFRWVVRNVLLHEQVDDWVPPAFTLRRGHGGALDRALVFLALMRQYHADSSVESRFEGCLIVSDSQPRRFLVAVREPKTSSLRLFDPRLGQAVLTRDGKNIATLQEALADPTLLQPSGITVEQVKKLEAWLVCPLFALAPRFKVLQDGLTDHPATLHMNAPTLAQEIAKASSLPTKVWNPPAEGKTLPNSPTRSLWMFLPKQEGGIDERQRALLYSRARMPLDNVVINLAAIRVDQQQMPQPAWITLLKLSGDLLNKYDLQPREMRLRGLRGPMLRRQNRLDQFVNMDTTRKPDEIPKWLDLVRTAYASLDDADPKVRAKAQQAVGALFGSDLFLARLIDADKDEEFDRKDKNLVLENRTVLSKILAVGLSEQLKFEIARTQAAANHEAAEHAQAMLQASSSPGPAAKKRAEEAWEVAKSTWGYYVDRISLNAKVEQARFVIHQRTPPGPQGLDMKLNLLERLHLDVHKYLHAKLRVAECKAHTDPGGRKAVVAYLEAIRSEVEALERKGALKSDIDAFAGAVAQLNEPFRGRFQRRLDLLAKDWESGGNYEAIRDAIKFRIAPD